MKLTHAQIYRYKSIDDSGPVEIDPKVTVLVGKNESGKTAFLEALNKSNPAETDVKFTMIEDYPRKALSKYADAHGDSPPEVTRLAYALTDTEVRAINATLGLELLKSRFSFTRSVSYSGRSAIGFDIPQKPYVQDIIKRLPVEVRRDLAGVTSVRDLLAKLDNADLNAVGIELRNRLVAQFGSAPDSWSNALSWFVWKNHVQPVLPKFLYFDDYKLLPDKVNLRRLQTTASAGTPDDESKTVLALLRMAGVDFTEVTTARRYEESKARLEALSISITDRVFLYWKQNKDLDVEFDVREDPTEAPPYNDGPNLYIRIKNRRHRVTVPFSQRSKGFIWFFSFIVWFDSIKQQAGTDGDLILLLDEPGLSLHAIAQHDLLEYIDKLSAEHQVIYTTHSPFMVPSDRLNCARVVEDREGEGTTVSDNLSFSDPGTLFPLQAALGYDIAQNLFIGKRNLLVEGPADLVYLKFFSALLESEGRTGLREDIVIVPVGGLDRVATFIALLGASRLELVVLHDSTGKPDQRIEQAVKDKLIRDKQVLNYGMFADGAKPRKANSSVAADVEDLISTALYLELFNETYAKELGSVREIDENELPAGRRIVERIDRFLDDHAIKLRPLNGFDHYRVASLLAAKVSVRKDADTLNRFEDMFKQVNRTFSAA
jgi:AAA ATPase-like protein/OLD-like protein